MIKNERKYKQFQRDYADARQKVEAIVRSWAGLYGVRVESVKSIDFEQSEIVVVYAPALVAMRKGEEVVFCLDIHPTQKFPIALLFRDDLESAVREFVMSDERQAPLVAAVNRFREEYVGKFVRYDSETGERIDPVLTIFPLFAESGRRDRDYIVINFSNSVHFEQRFKVLPRTFEGYDINAQVMRIGFAG